MIVDTAQTFTSPLSWKSTANTIMNLTCVSAWEVGEANSNLLRSSSSKWWRNMPGTGTSVQTNTTTAIKTSCPASALRFVTRGCHQLTSWPAALQDAELWGCLVRWQLFFHRRKGKLCSYATETSRRYWQVWDHLVNMAQRSPVAFVLF